VGQTYPGQITKIGSSALRSTNPFQMGSQGKANFEVIVTLDREVPAARPGFSCSAEIITGTAQAAIAAPIQAVTTRRSDLVAQEGFEGGHRGIGDGNGFGGGGPSGEVEGVFVVRDGRAWFTPIEIGLAGERFFEVLAGLKEGDRVIIGPHSVVRELAHGARVRIATTENAANATT
jgi:HlyD family secretion protein